MSPLKVSTPNLNDQAYKLILDVLKSGNLVQGEYVAELEAALGGYLGAPYVALVSSGTAALHLALLALELPKGAGVVVPDFTFPATVNAVLLSGLTPVIADVCPERYVVTELSVREAIERAHGAGVQVSALLPVHEFGQPVDPEALERIAADHQLKVIEDAACALGAQYQHRGAWRKVGTLSNVACFSFHPRKTLTTGEGGALVTRSKALYERLLELRSHGMRRGEAGVSFERAGFNYRMTDLQAAIGLSQLPALNEWLELRRALARRYHELLADSPYQLPPLSEGHSWQTFMVKVPPSLDRDQLIQELKAEGIEANIGAQVLSSLPYLSEFALSSAAHGLGPRSLALPMCERYGEEDIKRVSRALLKALKSS